MVLNLGFRTTGCPYVARTEAKMLCAMLRTQRVSRLLHCQLGLSDPYPDQAYHAPFA